MKLFAATIFLLVVSTALGVALTEFGLRFFMYGAFRMPSTYVGMREAHPTLGWSLVPNQRRVLRSADYTIRYETNSKGHRDKERRYEASPGQSRIVVVGDSFMEAYMVNREDTAPSRLEDSLTDIDVVNLGVGGFGTTQELIMLSEEGLKFDPSLAILMFFPQNDVYNNSIALEHELWGVPILKTFGRPFASVIGGSSRIEITPPDYERSVKWVANKRAQVANTSYWANTAIATRLNLLKQPNTAIKTPDGIPKWDPKILYGTMVTSFQPRVRRSKHPSRKYTAMWSDAWRTTYAVIRNMKRVCELNDVEFLMVLVPAKAQVDKKYRSLIHEAYPNLPFDIEKANRQLVEFGEVYDIRVLDLLPAFQDAEAEGQKLFYPVDRHWNPEGHRVAADAIHGYLVEHGLDSFK